MQASLPTLKDDKNLQTGSDAPSFEPSRNLTINRERCIDPTVVDNFLRYLRHGTDDILKLKLNKYRMPTTNTKEEQCDEFLKLELFPNWRIRDSVISFCEEEAKLMKSELDEHLESRQQNGVPIVTERIDPYSVKDRIEQKQAYMRDWESLNNWVESQRKIESIMQIRASSVLSESCGRIKDYLEDFDEFMKTHK